MGRRCLDQLCPLEIANQALSWDSGPVTLTAKRCFYTPPSRTPPASGVRGDMPTKGALTGLHGGYSEPGAGAARSAGATQMTCARGALGLAAEQCWQRTWSDLKNTKSEF